MKLSSEQLKIINTNQHRVVVCASAASGKTTCIVERLRRLISEGVDPSKIIAITFTNNAAEEISERLDRPKGVFIGTIHSYANQLLLAYNISTDDIISKEEFDNFFGLIKEHKGCIKPVEHLLLDEAQDSTLEQFEFLLDMIKPENWFLVGDWRQSLYMWNGATPDYLISLTKRKSVTTYTLKENYRNSQSILNFAKAIIRLAGIDYIDNSIPMIKTYGRVIEAPYDSTQLVKYIKSNGNYGKWFVLARTNEQVEIFSNILNREGIPFDSFRRAQLNNTQLHEKLKENSVKVLTIHAAKGLEMENVAVIGARFYNLEERCTSYVAATRAKQLLIWLRMPNRKRSMEMSINWET